MLSDLNPGYHATSAGIIPNSSSPRELTVIDDTLYFSAEGVHIGRELWKVQGNNQPVHVKDIFEGTCSSHCTSGSSYNSSSPTDLTVMNGMLYFEANTSDRGREIWVSDGTDEGTKLLFDIQPDGHGNPSDLTVVGDRLYFTADDGFHGRELWETDGIVEDNGTSPGTKIVKGSGFFPGPAGSHPDHLTAVGDTLYFSADDWYNGQSLWQINENNISLVERDLQTGQTIRVSLLTGPSDGVISEPDLTTVARDSVEITVDSANSTGLISVDTSDWIQQIYEEAKSHSDLNEVLEHSQFTIRVEAASGDATWKIHDAFAESQMGLQLRQRPQSGVQMDIYNSEFQVVAKNVNFVDMYGWKAGTYLVRVFDPSPSPIESSPEFELDVNLPVDGNVVNPTDRDTILGGEGSDWIIGSQANDWLFGEDGSDHFVAESTEIRDLNEAVETFVNPVEDHRIHNDANPFNVEVVISDSILQSKIADALDVRQTVSWNHRSLLSTSIDPKSISSMTELFASASGIWTTNVRGTGDFEFVTGLARNLSVVDLSHNQLTDDDLSQNELSGHRPLFQSMPNVKYFFLHDNHLSDIRFLLQLKELRLVTLNGNPLDLNASASEEGTAMNVIRQLQDRGVVVSFGDVTQSNLPERSINHDTYQPVVAAGDVDGDGIAEVYTAVMRPDGHAEIYRSYNSDFDNTLIYRSPTPGLVRVTAMAVGNVNGDQRTMERETNGQDDLEQQNKGQAINELYIAFEWSDGTASIHRSTTGYDIGSEIYRSTEPSMQTITALALGDTDGDNRDELYSAFSGANNEALVFRATSYGSLGTPIYVSQNTDISGLAVGDVVNEQESRFDDLGDELYVSFNRNGFGSIYMSGSGLDIGSRIYFAVQAHPWQVTALAIGDVDKDDRDELYSAFIKSNGETRIYTSTDGLDIGSGVILSRAGEGWTIVGLAIGSVNEDEDRAIAVRENTDGSADLYFWPSLEAEVSSVFDT